MNNAFNKSADPSRTHHPLNPPGLCVEEPWSALLRSPTCSAPGGSEVHGMDGRLAGSRWVRSKEYESSFAPSSTARSPEEKASFAEKPCPLTDVPMFHEQHVGLGKDEQLVNFWKGVL